MTLYIIRLRIMVRLYKIITVVLLFLLGCCYGSQKFKIPEVKFEVLESGGFRAYIPASSDITRFELNVNINREQLKGSIEFQVNNYFVINYNKTLNLGDSIFYDVKVIHKGFHYSKSDLIWEVKELIDSYTSLEECKKSRTLFNNKNAKCTGQLIISDDFNESIIDESKWVIEQWIPTYYGNNGNYEFNSYENVNETRFIKNGILYLKPVPRKDVHGVLDLRNGCTSTDNKQCYYEHNRAYLLPPVKSGRITSKLSFQYGKIEIKAKLPAGDWLNPVLQLQLNETNTDNETESPRTLIAYSRGNIQLCGAGKNNLGSHSLYGGPILRSNEMDRNKLLKSRYSEVPYSSDFHVYTLEWIPGKMSFYVDSSLYGEVATSHGFPEYRSNWNNTDAPFNKKYFISLGVAVGGIRDFPDECISGVNPKPWSNTEPKYIKSFFEARQSWLNTWNNDNTALQVDYVKVWSI